MRRQRDLVAYAVLAACCAVTAVVLLGDLPTAVDWPLAGFQTVLVVTFVLVVTRNRERAR